ncbi:MAG: ATP-binding protein [Candidatus Korarchaeota archaeon]|nr:ATP-binding protein [Candidatus Korarchaeota archaeon]
MRADTGDMPVIVTFILLAGILVYKRGHQLLLSLDLSSIATYLTPLMLVLSLTIVALRLRRGKRGIPSINAALVSTDRGTFLAAPLRIEVKGSESQLDFNSLSSMLEDLGVGITVIINRWPGRTFLSWKQEGSLFLSGLIWRKLDSLEETQSMIKAAISALNSSMDGIKVEIDQRIKLDPELFSEIMSMGYEGEELSVRVGRGERTDISVIELGESEGRTFGISLRDLTRHILIIGQTGSGKTTTAKRIIYEAWNLGIPSLILDIHWEYKGFVFQLGGRIFSTKEGLPLACINPLSDLHEVGATFLISETLSSILDLTPSQFYLMNRALKMMRDLSMSGTAPNLRDLVEIVRTLEPTSHAEEESRASLLRKIEPIVSSPGAEIFDCDNLNERILGETISLIEMGDVESDILKQIAVFFILKRLKDLFTREERKSAHPKLIVVIEEAEKLLPSYKDATGMDIIDRLFSELRKFGVSLVLVSQNISEIPEGVVRNAGTKIFHRMDSPSDVKGIRSLISDREIVDRITRLSTGECIVSTPKYIKTVEISPPEEEPLDPKSIEGVILRERFYFP